MGLIVKGTVETLTGASAASTGVGAGVGAFLVFDGVSSIGLGISTIMISFAPETENRNDASLSIMTSDILGIGGKGLDKGALNETPYFEIGAEVISSAISIGSIKSLRPTSFTEALSEAITVLQVGETVYDIYNAHPSNNTVDKSGLSQYEDVSVILDKWREAINSYSLWKQ